MIIIESSKGVESVEVGVLQGCLCAYSLAWLQVQHLSQQVDCGLVEVGANFA